MSPINTTPGLLVIISSPSGGGKDSVINALLKRFPNSARFVTTTSRPPRPGQKDGVDYHFISPDEFRAKIERGEFIEYNFYADNYYGTEKAILGRMHQIRAHLLAYNHPLVGDPLYKQKKRQSKWDAKCDRLFLHATKLSFTDLAGKRQTFESPLPKELEEFLKLLK